MAILGGAAAAWLAGVPGTLVGDGDDGARTKACGFDIGRHAYESTARETSCAVAREAAEAFQNFLAKDSLGAVLIERTPYDTLSRPFLLHVESLDFTCRFTPEGLGGGEHTVQCRDGSVMVRWTTWQT